MIIKLVSIFHLLYVVSADEMSTAITISVTVGFVMILTVMT
jgi:hypothetical protein